MKAVILAGGNGFRLNPLTLTTNKHLLGLHKRPVIDYAIEKLTNAGLCELMLVTSNKYLEDFKKILGSGDRFKTLEGKKLKIVYAIQDSPDGIAHGLLIAKDYIGKDSCVLYLGDNIIEDDIKEHIKNFNKGAKIFLKQVSDPRRFGVAIVDSNNKVVAIEEKPENPKSNLAVAGLYVYDNSVFDKMTNQPKSNRGEYEITYINNKYIAEDALESVILQKNWFDIGTIKSLRLAAEYMYNKYENDKK